MDDDRLRYAQNVCKRRLNSLEMALETLTAEKALEFSARLTVLDDWAWSDVEPDPGRWQYLGPLHET